MLRPVQRGGYQIVGKHTFMVLWMGRSYRPIVPVRLSRYTGMGDIFSTGLESRNRITLISLESLSRYWSQVRAQAAQVSRLVAKVRCRRLTLEQERQSY